MQTQTNDTGAVNFARTQAEAEAGFPMRLKRGHVGDCPSDYEPDTDTDPLAKRVRDLELRVDDLRVAEIVRELSEHPMPQTRQAHEGLRECLLYDASYKCETANTRRDIDEIIALLNEARELTVE